MSKLEAVEIIINYVKALDEDEEERYDSWIPTVASLETLKERIEQKESNGNQ